MKSLPKWEQLPTLDLYLDQVLLYVNDVTQDYRPSDEKELTAAMVNNYVKHSFLPKPLKKKYQTAHIARLIILTICKPVFPIATIHEAIQSLTQENEASVIYDDFAVSITQESTSDFPLIGAVCQTLCAYHETLQLLQKENENEPAL